jgi:hypothetical protein
MTAAPTVDAQLRHLEQQLLQPEVRGSAERLASLLAENFVEFGSSGRVFNKKQIVAALTKEAPMKRSLSAFEATMLSAHVALVTYRATRRSSQGGEPVRTLRSSIWRRSNGEWKMVFHQGTLAR